MDDNERMVAAARRAARRLAKRTGNPYQTCLDIVARDCGRRHWAHFMEDPAPIPQEEVRRVAAAASAREAMLRAIGCPLEMREVWSAGPGDLPDGWPEGLFMPGFNALDPRILPDDPAARRSYLSTLAEVMIPRNGRGNDYFDAKGRETLAAFLLLAVEDMGDRASIPALIDMINEGLRTASRMYDEDREQAAREGRFSTLPDRLGLWLGTIDLLVREKNYDQAILDGIVPLVSMAPNERSGILGTMDRGLIVFKSADVRRRTSA